MISATTTNMTRPILVKVLFLYVVYFVYAVLGQVLFGGKITLEGVA